ncbi:MAG: type IV toxin-antitoxin system AbiEi family antitoxin domain-containing protein [Actinomycetota bacterium]
MGGRTTEIPADVREVISRGGGILRASAAIAAGIPESRLRRLVAAGLLARVAEGSYVDAKAMRKLDEWQRFALHARAFVLSCGPDVYLTGWASTALRGLPTLGSPPRRPTLVRSRPHGKVCGPRSSDRARIVVAHVPADHLRLIGPVRIMSTEWSVADLARTAPLPHALVVADAVVRIGGDLRGVLPHMGHWPGVHRSRWVAEYADSAAESPLETLGRFAFLEFDLPLPVANAWVGRDGPERRVDGLLPWHWWAFEGDGAMKYDNRDDASLIVRDQQEREFQLRRLGLDFLRYGWPDVYPSRRPLAEKARALLGDRQARERPVRWWKHVPGRGPVEPAPQDWPSAQPAGVVLPAGWNVDLGDPPEASDGDA